jgi:hypothetical protein
MKFPKLKKIRTVLKRIKEQGELIKIFTPKPIDDMIDLAETGIDLADTGIEAAKKIKDKEE